MRDAITAAGLPLDCKPHELRKAPGRRMADAGCTAHGGHTTLAEAERHTREADRRRGGHADAKKLEAHKADGDTQPGSANVENVAKINGKSI